MQLYLLSSIPYYNSIKQEYTNILILNKQPEGPLLNITKQIQQNKLSPFESNTNLCPKPRCVYALTNGVCCNDLLCVDELPILFEFLLNNGYLIDDTITKLMHKSNVTLNGNLICYIKY